MYRRGPGDGASMVIRGRATPEWREKCAVRMHMTVREWLMDLQSLRVDGTRLRDSLERMAEIGATPGGGVERLALSDEDRAARDLFISWLEEIHMEVTVDEVGNIFGRRPGTRDDLPPVMSGSHIDSQPKGGRFDGILGVMGALEVLRTLHDHDIETVRPVTAVSWTNEEGARFSPALLGSGVWTGAMDRDRVYGITDADGTSFERELDRIGYKGSVPAETRPFHCYYELHIEQGPVLDRIGTTIGIPRGILGMHWYDVFVRGTANQMGPTPMDERNDALCAAAEMILKVNDLPSKMGGDLVATVGHLDTGPESRNIIQDFVHLPVDIRSWDDGTVAEAWNSVLAEFEEIAARRGCCLETRRIWALKHAPFDEILRDTLLTATRNLGYSYHEMISGAGHDAGNLNAAGPTAMIFVPSIGGRSHVEIEDTRWEDCEAGTNVLLHGMVRSADEQ